MRLHQLALGLGGGQLTVRRLNLAVIGLGLNLTGLQLTGQLLDELSNLMELGGSLLGFISVALHFSGLVSLRCLSVAQLNDLLAELLEFEQRFR